MAKPFKLETLEEQKKEFLEYKGKEVGLPFHDSSKGIAYGIVHSEDLNNVYLKPHLAYNPMPLPDGNFTQNIEKRNTIKKIPKNTLAKLVHEYNYGYLDELTEMTKARDNFLINNYNNNNIPENRRITISKR